jgi:alanine dehydrogenase
MNSAIPNGSQPGRPHPAGDPRQTLLLRGEDVQALLSHARCISAVEDAFRRAALGEVPPSAILGMQGGEGSFHVKAGLLAADASYFAAKVNANFPRNAQRFGLPTIQGAVLLFSAADGRLLALMDSMALTARRTAAATAVAAKFLARASSATVLLCGCGAQALDQLGALLCVRSVERVLAFDLDAAKASAFAATAQAVLGVGVVPALDLQAAMLQSDIVITCTTARKFFVTSDRVRPGTFIAAVGADHEDKQEIAPELMARAKVVTDSTEQARRIGDLHHAIAAGAMRAADVHAELGEIIAGAKTGRVGEEEVTVFDSTGTGLQDVAAAIAVFCAAITEGRGSRFSFA